MISKGEEDGTLAAIGATRIARDFFLAWDSRDFHPHSGILIIGSFLCGSCGEPQPPGPTYSFVIATFGITSFTLCLSAARE